MSNGWNKIAETEVQPGDVVIYRDPVKGPIHSCRVTDNPTNGAALDPARVKVDSKNGQNPFWKDRKLGDVDGVYIKPGVKKEYWRYKP